MVSFSVCRVSIPLIQSSRERLPGRCKRYLGEVSVNIPVSKKRGRRGGGGNFCGSSSWWRGDLFPILCSPAFYRDWPTRVPQEMGDPDATVRTTATKFAVYIQKTDLSPLHARMQRASRDVLHAKKKMRFPPRIAVIPLGVGWKIVGTLEETQEWRKFLLVMNGGLAWGCVSWTR